MRPYLFQDLVEGYSLYECSSFEYRPPQLRCQAFSYHTVGFQHMAVSNLRLVPYPLIYHTGTLIT